MTFAAAILLTACSLGAVAGFLVSTGRALKKFERLDAAAQGKVLLLDYYMAAVRNLSEGDLERLSRLPDDAIRWFNGIGDYDERLREMRAQIIMSNEEREEGAVRERGAGRVSMRKERGAKQLGL
jgi:hypothetical protein